MSDLKVYENVLVSPVQYDFSQNSHESIPNELYADWVTIVSKIAAVVDTNFKVPPFPQSVAFRTEMIPSDGPYSANENYYTLDYVSYRLTADQYGIIISFENGRQDGDNSVGIETLGYSSSESKYEPNFLVSSYIPKKAVAPRAKFFVWHKPEKTSEIEGVFARHQKECLENL